MTDFDKNLSVVSLLNLLDARFGRSTWTNLQVETLMFELGHPDYLVQEKIYVLHAVVNNLNYALSQPEFLLWFTSVVNNEYADFETITLPTSLELAWAIEEAKKLSLATGQVFSPSFELIQTLTLLLKEDGFSEPIKPFDFIPASNFNEGQTKEDVDLKKKAIKTYIAYMTKQTT